METIFAERFRSATRAVRGRSFRCGESLEDGRLPALRCGGWFGLFLFAIHSSHPIDSFSSSRESPRLECNDEDWHREQGNNSDNFFR